MTAICVTYRDLELHIIFLCDRSNTVQKRDVTERNSQKDLCQHPVGANHYLQMGQPEHSPQCRNSRRTWETQMGEDPER